MTMTAFLPFDRKPGKNVASMICKYSNMVSKATTGVDWMFQGPVTRGRGSMLVQLVDFRDFLKSSDPEVRDWADDAGWTAPWSIAISVTHKRRTNEEYAFWHAFTAVLWNAYRDSLASEEIWLTADDDGFPTTPFTFNEFLPDFNSADAEDVSPSEEYEEVVTDLPPPPPQRMQRAPQRMQRAPAPAPEPKPEPKPEPEPEPEPEPLPPPPPSKTNPQEVEVVEDYEDEDEDEGQGLVLVPMDFGDDEDDYEDEDEEDDFEDDFENDFEDEEEDDFEDEEEEDSGAITDW